MCGSPAGRTHKSLDPDFFDSKNHSNVLKVDATSVANPVVQFTLPEHRLYEEKQQGMDGNGALGEWEYYEQIDINSH